MITGSLDTKDPDYWQKACYQVHAVHLESIRQTARLLKMYREHLIRFLAREAPECLLINMGESLDKMIANAEDTIKTVETVEKIICPKS